MDDLIIGLVWGFFIFPLLIPVFAAILSGVFIGLVVIAGAFLIGSYFFWPYTLWILPIIFLYFYIPKVYRHNFPQRSINQLQISVYPFTEMTVAEVSHEHSNLEPPTKVV